MKKEIKLTSERRRKEKRPSISMVKNGKLIMSNAHRAMIEYDPECWNLAGGFRQDVAIKKIKSKMENQMSRRDRRKAQSSQLGGRKAPLQTMNDAFGQSGVIL